MKIYKLLIFITIFMGLAAFNSADAIKIDFLNKPSSVQLPPLNISSDVHRNINPSANQGQAGASSSTGTLQVSNETTVPSTLKNISGVNNSWWIVALSTIAIFIIALALIFVKKRRNGIIR